MYFFFGRKFILNEFLQNFRSSFHLDLLFSLSLWTQSGPKKDICGVLFFYKNTVWVQDVYFINLIFLRV